MQQLHSCKEYIPSFSAKLKALDIDALPITDYCKRYLAHLQVHRNYYLHIYAHVLDNAIVHSQRKHSEMTLVDYGCGNGLLGLFAKSCGIKKVWLCDTEKHFLEAAKHTSAALQITADDYIPGDTEDLVLRLQDETVNAVVGTDVIEHIYDLDAFFGALARLDGCGITVFTTASNPDNFFKKRALQRLQLRDEFIGSKPADFTLAGAEPHLPFLTIRKNIIRENFPVFTTQQLQLLADRTRGLRREDIVKACARYMQTGTVPATDALLTNTCDPDTGSWTERIIPMKNYQALYRRFGMSLIVKNGFYNEYGTGFKKIINKCMNVFITLTGRNTAPFITLIGCKKDSGNSPFC